VTFDWQTTSGPAGDFHAREMPMPVQREVWQHDVTRPALVLGSTQRSETVDALACAVAGIDVVRRRSGGGAVLLEPGKVLWLDVLLPAGDPLWSDDVSRSTLWLGEAWARALGSCGLTGVEVHSGAMVCTECSSVVCFAGVAPGEVTVAGRKVVGISQRRNRHGARFQCAVLSVWDPIRLLALLAPPWRGTDPNVLFTAASSVPVPLSELALAFRATLNTQPY
jgi:lipoate-protein ligase A